MPTIGIPKEFVRQETRISATPDSVKKLSYLEGVEVLIEKGLGQSIQVQDRDFEKAGALITEREKVLSSDYIFQISPLSKEVLGEFK